MRFTPVFLAALAVASAASTLAGCAEGEPPIGGLPSATPAGRKPPRAPPRPIGSAAAAPSAAAPPSPAEPEREPTP